MCIRDRSEENPGINGWNLVLSPKFMKFTKNQEQGSDIAKPYPQELAPYIYTSMKWKAVSYTHLDVYKRQALNKVKYCRKCGNTINNSVKFCRHCGALQNNQSKSPSVRDSQPSKKNIKGPDVIDNSIKQKQKEKYFSDNETKTAKKKRGIFGKIAALLLIIFISVNIINFLSGKPNEPSGVSTTTGNDENKGISEYVRCV